MSFASFPEQLDAFAAASRANEKDAFGFFIGYVDGERCVPLSAVAQPRLPHDWAERMGPAEAARVTGLFCVGAWAVCSGTAPLAEQLLALIEPNIEKLVSVVSGGAATKLPLQAGNGIVLAAVPAAGDAVEFFEMFIGPGPKKLRPIPTPSRDEAVAGFRSVHVALHVSTTIRLEVACDPELEWGSEESTKIASLKKQMTEMFAPERLHFTLPAAKQLGVVGIDSRESATVGSFVADGAADRNDMLELQCLWALSPATLGGACAAPMLENRGGEHARRVVGWDLPVESLLYVRRDLPLGEALRQLHAVLVATAGEIPAMLAHAKHPTPAAARHVRPHHLTFHPPMLPTGLCWHVDLREGGDAAETAMRDSRALLHAALGLPMDRPLLRSSHALGAAASAGGRCFPGILTNPHEGLAPSGVKRGAPVFVQGTYEYFHYMQRTGHGLEHRDARYDDAGWGCAYRSLMSIISWYRCQQYTSFRNPTHLEIQKRLVEHCGQPRDELLGKKMWIGSLELSLFLEHAIGVECRTASYPSADAIAADGRRIAHHFETQGTPVMIGGGELAFTLLGVHFDPQSGDIRYLIMDPHYTGADDLSQIQPKWVGWKSADSPTHMGTPLFTNDKFYNFCFPQRQKQI